MADRVIDPKKGYADLTAQQKVAVLMRAIGTAKAKVIFDRLTEDEARRVAQAMAELGPVEPGVVDEVLREYANQLEDDNHVVGTPMLTQKFLEDLGLPRDKVEEFLAELRGPAGDTVWDKLGNVPDQQLYGYLMQQHPQMKALVLASLDETKAGRILAMFPKSEAHNIALRISYMEPVDEATRERLEQNISQKLLSSQAQFTSQADGSVSLARILNRTRDDRTQEVLDYLENYDATTAKKVRRSMFTFDDFLALDDITLRKVLPRAEPDDIKKSIANESEDNKQRIFGNLPDRKAKTIRREMDEMGRVRRGDMEEARMRLIETARQLEREGEVDLTPEDADEEV